MSDSVVLKKLLRLVDEHMEDVCNQSEALTSLLIHLKNHGIENFSKTVSVWAAENPSFFDENDIEGRLKSFIYDLIKTSEEQED